MVKLLSFRLRSISFSTVMAIRCSRLLMQIFYSVILLVCSLIPSVEYAPSTAWSPPACWSFSYFPRSCIDARFN